MLSLDLTAQVLRYLGCTRCMPGLAALDELVHAYVRRVPWESAFRIARKGRATQPVDARTPELFWVDAIERGGGGTCFESNYAFLALLRTLGYAGHLTINNMGESVGCHTAIVADLAGERYLTDVGIPLHCPLLLRRDATTYRPSHFHNYRVRPVAPDRYIVERTRHPKPYVFTLIETAVDELTYIAASTDDYGPQGLFLDRVIINKVIGDSTWRFSSGERPFRLERFDAGGRRMDLPLSERELAPRLAAHFSMDVSVISRALAATGVVV